MSMDPVAPEIGESEAQLEERPESHWKEYGGEPPEGWALNVTPLPWRIVGAEGVIALAVSAGFTVKSTAVVVRFSGWVALSCTLKQ